MFDLSKVEKEVSWSPLKPGINIPVILEKVEISEATDKSAGGDLDFFFKGTSFDNAGNFKARFWANSFDNKEDKYNEKNAENLLKQIRQICEAYLPEGKVNLIKGSNWGELSNAVVIALPSDVILSSVLLKVVYKYNSDKDIVLPNYGSFISSELMVRGLSLSDKTKNGVPYDRVLPLSQYASADSGIPTDDMFAVIDDVPVF